MLKDAILSQQLSVSIAWSSLDSSLDSSCIPKTTPSTKYLNCKLSNFLTFLFSLIFLMSWQFVECTGPIKALAGGIKQSKLFSGKTVTFVLQSPKNPLLKPMSFHNCSIRNLFVIDRFDFLTL